MNPLSVGHERALDLLTLGVLRHVDRVARERSLDYFVIGATARDILLYGVFGIATGRATQDVDLAVAVAAWEEFEAVKTQLLATGEFITDGRVAHKLHFRSASTGRGYPLDLVPFGGAEEPQHRIAWPPDRSVAMNLVGFPEALASTVSVEVEPGFVVPVASLPGLAILKFVAWTGRGADSPKDGMDLAVVLSQYNAAGNDDRLYGAEIGLLEAANYDLELAGTRLLGMDARRIVAPATRDYLLALLTDPVRFDCLVVAVARGVRATEDPVVAAGELLAQFKAGFQQT